MILLDYFIFGAYHFIQFSGKNEEDVKYMGIFWAIFVIALGIWGFAEMYMVLNGLSTDSYYITRESMNAFYWSFLILILISLLRYYIFSKTNWKALILNINLLQ